jgi:GNAT superfamily N-acetyltransferase
MSERFPVEFVANPSSDIVDVIAEGLNRFNGAKGGDDNYQPFALVIRNEAGEIVGGLNAATFFGWLAIELLWVDDAFRGQGYGSELLRQAEAIGRERGCERAYLNTMSFQAPAFYESFGYVEFARLPNDARGFKRHYFQKTLLPTSNSPK